MSNAEKEMKDLRDEISKLDDSIVKLLDQRASITKKIGDAKKKLGRPIIDRAREHKVYLDVTSKNTSYLTRSQLQAIYKEIIGSCRAVQIGKKRVAYLGPPGTFSEQAANQYFSEAEAEFIITQNITDIFRKVINDEAEFGVVPVENSTSGSITLTLDLLLENNLNVLGEIIIRIQHNLIAMNNIPLSEVKILLSHEQPLAQCRKFIEKNLPQVEIIETKSTSLAIEMLPDYENAVAIGTELAAELYSRTIIAKGIEDNQNNFTRFFIISHEKSDATGSDKTSIVFSVRHVPGALLTALKCFSSRNINLTKLESRPARLTPWEYYFYTDFEGHVTEPRIQEALDDLKNSTLYIKVLGSYPKHSTQ
jgi:chorismate mutase/prephenate dehydratase